MASPAATNDNSNSKEASSSGEAADGACALPLSEEAGASEENGLGSQPSWKTICDARARDLAAKVLVELTVRDGPSEQDNNPTLETVGAHFGEVFSRHVVEVAKDAFGDDVQTLGDLRAARRLEEEKAASENAINSTNQGDEDLEEYAQVNEIIILEVCGVSCKIGMAIIGCHFH